MGLAFGGTRLGVSNEGQPEELSILAMEFRRSINHKIYQYVTTFLLIYIYSHNQDFLTIIELLQMEFA